MSRQPFVSIVITTLNVESTIDECLQSLVSMNYPNDRYEIIVVDGGSSDETRSIMQRHAIRFMELPGSSIGEGRNAGIKAAKGEIIAITDGDMVVPPEWLQELVEPFADPSVGAVGGPNLPHPDSNLFSRLVGLLPEEGPMLNGAVCEVNHLLLYTRNAAYRRDTLSKAGLFFEQAVAGEDPELNWRIVKAGYRLIFAPQAFVHHHHRSNLRSFLRQHFRNGVGVGQITTVNPRVYRTWLNVAGLSLLIGLPALFVGSTLLSSWPLLLIGLMGLASATVYLIGRGFLTFRRTRKIRHIFLVAAMTALWQPFFLAGYLLGLLKGPRMGLIAREDRTTVL